MVRVLASIHSVDVDRAGLNDFGKHGELSLSLTLNSLLSPPLTFSLPPFLVSHPYPPSPPLSRLHMSVSFLETAYDFCVPTRQVLHKTGLSFFSEVVQRTESLLHMLVCLLSIGVT